MGTGHLAEPAGNCAIECLQYLSARASSWNRAAAAAGCPLSASVSAKLCPSKRPNRRCSTARSVFPGASDMDPHNSLKYCSQCPWQRMPSMVPSEEELPEKSPRRWSTDMHHAEATRELSGTSHSGAAALIQVQANTARDTASGVKRTVGKRQTLWAKDGSRCEGSLEDQSHACGKNIIHKASAQVRI